MNTCIATLCDRRFLPGLHVMLKSLIRTNPDMVDNPLVIMTPEEFTPDEMQTIERLPYQGTVIWKRIDTEPYLRIQMDQTEDRYRAAYYKFEVFNLVGYDRVVFLDSDLLINGDISLLFQTNGDIAAVIEREINQFNTGVMVVGKSLLGQGLTEKLIDMSAHGNNPHADQEAINTLLRPRLTELPFWYNVLKTYFRHWGTWQRRARIIHFVARNPWDHGVPVGGDAECLMLESMWWHEKNR